MPMGAGCQNVGRGSGGAPGLGRVNVETKNAYIDLQAPWVPGLSFRGGIIGWGVISSIGPFMATDIYRSPTDVPAPGFVVAVDLFKAL
jgi:hypothetical protein